MIWYTYNTLSCNLSSNLQYLKQSENILKLKKHMQMQMQIIFVGIGSWYWDLLCYLKTFIGLRQSLQPFAEGDIYTLNYDKLFSKEENLTCEFVIIFLCVSNGDNLKIWSNAFLSVRQILICDQLLYKKVLDLHLDIKAIIKRNKAEINCIPTCLWGKMICLFIFCSTRKIDTYVTETIAE
jgi:hypothetical protein